MRAAQCTQQTTHTHTHKHSHAEMYILRICRVSWNTRAICIAVNKKGHNPINLM